jgi:hypothetical protein
MWGGGWNLPHLLRNSRRGWNVWINNRAVVLPLLGDIDDN